MSYQLVARPGQGHQGLEPLTPMGSCCSSCSSGGPCASGGLLPSIPSRIEWTPVNIAIAGGLAFLVYTIMAPKRKKA